MKMVMVINMDAPLLREAGVIELSGSCVRVPEISGPDISARQALWGTSVSISICM